MRPSRVVILVLAAIAAAVGPALMVVGTLVSSIASMASALGIAFLPMAGIAAGVVAALVGIVGAIILLYTKCAWFRDAVAAVGRGVVAVFRWLKDAVVRAIDFVRDHWAGWAAAISEAARPLVQSLLPKLATIWRGLSRAVGAAVD
ncbi:MAG: hypothetical protein ACP5UQ_16805, partial [Anaerolineae bacterium]